MQFLVSNSLLCLTFIVCVYVFKGCVVRGIIYCKLVLSFDWRLGGGEGWGNIHNFLLFFITGTHKSEVFFSLNTEH